MNEQNNNNSLAVVAVSRQDLTAVVTSSENRLGAIETVGTWIAKSGMFGCNNENQGKVIAMTCLETGMGLVEFSRTYDVVENKIRKKALAALAEFKRHGGKFKWIKSGDELPVTDSTAATVQLTYDGETITYSYSIYDAKTERLYKADSRYVKRPGNMLRARCITNGLGMIAPEIFAGELEEEEREQPQIALAPAQPAQAASVTVEPKAPAVAKTQPASPKPTVVVVDAEIVKPEPSKVSPPEDAKVEAAMGLAPVQEPPSHPSAATTSGLSPELSQKLMEAFQTNGIDWKDAMAWCRENPQGNSWLKPNEGLECLAEGNAKYLLTKVSTSFKRILADWVSKRGAK